MGYPDHCRWLRLAWAHRHSQILTRSFDSYIVSWSLLWFPVISWCSLFKRERCKLMQDHARKSKILYYILYIFMVSSLGEGVWDSRGLHGFCPPLLSAYICAVCLGLPGVNGGGFWKMRGGSQIGSDIFWPLHFLFFHGGRGGSKKCKLGGRENVTYIFWRGGPPHLFVTYIFWPPPTKRCLRGWGCWQHIIVGRRSISCHLVVIST